MAGPGWQGLNPRTRENFGMWPVEVAETRHGGGSRETGAFNNMGRLQTGNEYLRVGRGDLAQDSLRGSSFYSRGERDVSAMGGVQQDDSFSRVIQSCRDIIDSCIQPKDKKPIRSDSFQSAMPRFGFEQRDVGLSGNLVSRGFQGYEPALGPVNSAVQQSTVHASSRPALGQDKIYQQQLEGSMRSELRMESAGPFNQQAVRTFSDQNIHQYSQLDADRNFRGLGLQEPVQTAPVQHSQVPVRAESDYLAARGAGGYQNMMAVERAGGYQNMMAVERAGGVMSSGKVADRDEQDVIRHTEREGGGNREAAYGSDLRARRDGDVDQSRDRRHTDDRDRDRNRTKCRELEGDRDIAIDDQARRPFQFQRGHSGDQAVVGDTNREAVRDQAKDRTGRHYEENVCAQSGERERNAYDWGHREGERQQRNIDADTDRGYRDASRGPTDTKRGPRESERGPRDERGLRDLDSGPRDRGHTGSDRGPRDSDRGPRGSDKGSKDNDRGPRDSDRGQRDSDRGVGDRERQRSVDQERERESSRQRERCRERGRPDRERAQSRERGRHTGGGRDRDRDRRSRDRDRSRSRDRDRSRSRDRGRGRSRDQDRDRGRSGNQDRDRGRGGNQDRERGYSRDQDRGHSGNRDRECSRNRDRDRGRSRDQDRERSRDRERDRRCGWDRDRGRSWDRDRDDARDRDEGPGRERFGERGHRFRDDRQREEGAWGGDGGLGWSRGPTWDYSQQGGRGYGGGVDQRGMPWVSQSSSDPSVQHTYMATHPVAPQLPPPVQNQFRNDGSFIEMFKRQMQATGAEKTEADTTTTGTVADTTADTGPVILPTPAYGAPVVAKRRITKILKTGMVQKKKVEGADSEDSSDAWSRYMQEVKKYRANMCIEDEATRPLMK